VRLDRKLLLIAPTIVLVFVVAGIISAAVQLHVLSGVSDTLKERSDFIAAVERGQKTLDERQALGIIHLQFDVESKRTAAIGAARDLLIVLSAIGLVAVGVLTVGVRSVPREHWPRMSFGRGDAAPAERETR
jgi:hypothetical protein